MTSVELFEKVEAHPELQGVGVLDTDKGPAVQVKHTTSGLVTQFPIEAIDNLSWTDLEPVLLCNREPSVLHQISRVVGYFSRIGNWNQSKIGELKDRRKGTYTVTESAR